MATKVELIRSDSRGIQGTIDNAKHHAEAILPYIRAMKPLVSQLGFAKWRQGHNVHEFVTTEGTKYTLRAFTRDEVGGREYVGIRLALRVSRSVEHRLIDIDDISKIPNLLEAMKLLAVPQLGNNTRLIASSAA